MEKIKVLHVLWSGRTGGAERFVKDIVIYSDNTKFKHVTCFLSSGGIIADQIKQIGGNVIVLGMKSGFDILGGLKLVGLFKRENAHIIHVHIRTYFVTMLLCLLSSSAGRVYFEHGGDLIGNSPQKEGIFYKLFGKFYSTIFANSDYVKQRIIGASRILENRVKTLTIGIDAGKYKKYDKEGKDALKNVLHIPIEDRVVGVVGRLVPAKGIDDFIKTAVEIMLLCKKVSFVIVGDGVLRPRFEKLAIDLNIKICFLGERSDVPKILPIFDIFLFTSKWESFGIVLLEAMASRVPIVGFSVSGANEIFRNGGGALLIDERNHRKLAKLVADTLNDEETLEKLRDEGNANVKQNFDIRKTVEYLEQEYNTLVKQKN